MSAAVASWPPQAEQTEQDRLRMSKREGVRRDIARAGVLREKAAAIQAEIDRLNRAVADAADAHNEATAPLQDELQRLETAAIDRISRREPSGDPADDARRIELVQQIEQENGRLERVSREIEPEVKRLTAERSKLEREIAGLRTRQFLASPGVGCPVKLRQQYALSQFNEMLQVWRRGLLDKIEGGAYADKITNGATDREGRWTEVLRLCDEKIGETRKALDTLYEEIVSE